MAAKILDSCSLRVMSDEEVAALEVFSSDEPDGSVGVPRPGYIYVLQEGISATGYYKLGSSGDLGRRLANLQTGNPRQLGILKKWIVGDMTAAEGKARKAVEQYAATLGGGREWYDVASNHLQTFLTAINGAVAGQ